jgi:hypothetical protein
VAGTAVSFLRRWARGVVVAATLALPSPTRIAAQAVRADDAPLHYGRVLQIIGNAEAGSFTVISAATGWTPTASHPWVERLTPRATAGTRVLVPRAARLRLFANSRFPVGRNDGAVWQGRGVTMAVDFGATATWTRLTATVQPTVLFTGNVRFQLAPVSLPGMPPYAYPWRVIDMPQRFGDQPFWTLDWGQSEVRLDTGPVSVGFGTANLWWGPGIRNAIVMSDNAPGFPHAFVGTNGPAATSIGSFEARWIWGRLAQSEWFDPAARIDRFLTGIALGYSPSFIEGLTLGATRVFYSIVPADGVPVGEYFAVLRGLRKERLATQQNPTGDDDHDQLLSLFFRWVLTDDGFEVYAEWARNDHSWKVSDFLLEPEHSQAHTVGLQKAVPLSDNRLLAFRAELTHLERSTTFQVRDTPTYYAHSIVTQGYTHRGQIIGAGIGPGGNSQHIGADLYAPWGRTGVYLERQVHDNDAYYVWAEANNAEFCCHDVSIHLGSEALFFVGDFDLGAGFIATHEYHRNFFGLDLWNLNLSLSARWRPE